MLQDPTNLENLVDIVTVEPVSSWPPAAGWWFIGLLIVIWGAFFAVRAMQHWVRNQYRREALQLLEQMQANLPGEHKPTLVEINELLKRTALAAYPREMVAPLSGSQWLDFLDQSSGESAFQKEPASRLATAAVEVDVDDLSPSQLRTVLETCQRWIRNHLVEATR